jgi:ABC-type nitrate/sulfonate/bicarbonate transport system substrate-binding protein
MIAGVLPPLLLSAPWFVAAELGYLPPSVAVERAIPSLAERLQRIAAGAIQFSYVNPSGALNQAILDGLPLMAVAAATTLNRRFPLGGIVVSERLWRAGVRAVPDLRGRELHVPFGWDSGAGRAVWGHLERAGLDPRRDVAVHFHPGAPALGQAFLRGEVDAMQNAEPQLTMARLRTGARVIAHGEDLEDGATANLVIMNRAWVAAHRDETAALLAGYRAGLQRYLAAQARGWASDPDVWQVLLRLNVAPDVLAQVSGPYVDPAARIDRGSVQRTMEQLRRMGVVERSAPLDRYIEEAAACGD